MQGHLYFQRNHRLTRNLVFRAILSNVCLVGLRHDAHNRIMYNIRTCSRLKPNTSKHRTSHRPSSTLITRRSISKWSREFREQVAKCSTSYSSLVCLMYMLSMMGRRRDILIRLETILLLWWIRSIALMFSNEEILTRLRLWTLSIWGVVLYSIESSLLVQRRNYAIWLILRLLKCLTKWAHSPLCLRLSKLILRRWYVDSTRALSTLFSLIKAIKS